MLSIVRRSPADAQPVFEAIVQSAARLCGAIFSVVYLYENDHLRVAATKNFTVEATNQINERQELRQINRSYVGGRAVLDRAIAHVPDVLEDPEYSREFALAGGWRAVLAVPLLHEGNSVGAITVGKAEPKAFSERQIQLLQTFADQAVIAIENVRLFDAEQQRTRELSESLEQQTATSEVLKSSAARPANLSRYSMLCWKTRRASVRLSSATCSCTREINFARSRSTIRRATPIIGERNPVIDPHKPESHSIARQYETGCSHSRSPGRSVLHRERDPHHRSRQVAGARTFLHVPMLKEGELVGA